jgi:UDP-N-acetyl-D-mannosaminuronic acid dehydrogenase
MRELGASLNPSSTVIAVIGLGYVGLPVACEFARAGYRVIGVDVDEERLAKINAGICPIEGSEPELPALLLEVIQSGRFFATSDYNELASSSRFGGRSAMVAILNVETPVDQEHVPRYAALRSACRSLRAVLPDGALVIVESTVAPGTCHRVVMPELGLSPEDTTARFFVGACPERVMPGRLLFNLRSLSRVCGSDDPSVARTMVDLYRRIVKTADLDTTDLITSELVKTAENAHRDVNIAFANELALICKAVNADVWRVRELVNKSPGRAVLEPGGGVGGHCLPKDTWLLAHALSSDDAAEGPKLLSSARSVNDAMPAHVARLTVAALARNGKSLDGARVTVLGWAYREDTDDDRNSPSQAMCRILRQAGLQVVVQDPHVHAYRVGIEEAVKNADAVVLMVRHAAYRDLVPAVCASLMAKKPVAIDARGFLTASDWRAAGFDFDGVGVKR